MSGIVLKSQNNDKQLQELIKKISQLAQEKHKVKVGIIAGGQKPKDAKVTQAFIGLVNEFGSVTMNIPERSFIRKPLNNHLADEIASHSKVIADSFFKNSNPLVPYNKLGAIGEAVIKESFTNKGDGTWSPNAPLTVEGGWARNKKNGKIFYTKGKGENNPLINTGTLRRLISYEVD